MGSSFRIGTVMGIDIKLHITFLMVLPIFVMIFAVNSAPYGFGDIEPPMQYVLALLCTVLLFTCVLLHELGHSYFAQKYPQPCRTKNGQIQVRSHLDL